MSAPPRTPADATIAAAPPLPKSWRWRLARIVTDVMSPPHVGVALMLLAGGLDPRPMRGVLLAAVVGFFACLLPEAILLLGVRRGRWSDRNLTERRHRVVPLACVVVSGALGIALVIALDAPRAVVVVALAGVAGVAAQLLINLVWKSSIHAGSAAGGVVLAYVLAGPWSLPVTLPAAGLALWARVELRHHTLAQVVVGALLGLAIAALTCTALT